MLKAHEVTTLRSKIMGHKTKYFIEKYIVIARSTSAAVSLVPLKDGEEVLEAKELQNHQVIMEGEK
jgi:hypothetical protein